MRRRLTPGKQALVRRAGVLNALVGVVEQAGARALPRQRHLKRVLDQRGLHVAIHRPAHDPAGAKRSMTAARHSQPSWVQM
jgi:hypothetical protein